MLVPRGFEVEGFNVLVVLLLIKRTRGKNWRGFECICLILGCFI